MRLRIERDPDCLIFRLPGRLGVSCWPPYLRSFLIGVQVDGEGAYVEWHLGPFAGEVWRDEREDEGPTPATVEYLTAAEFTQLFDRRASPATARRRASDRADQR